VNGWMQRSRRERRSDGIKKNVNGKGDAKAGEKRNIEEGGRVDGGWWCLGM